MSHLKNILIKTAGFDANAISSFLKKFNVQGKADPKAWKAAMQYIKLKAPGNVPAGGLTSTLNTAKLKPLTKAFDVAM